MDRSNRAEDKKHEKKHAKNILCERLDKHEKTRAHTFPADYECYKFWWPMFKLVTGLDRLGWDYDKLLIQKLANMRTSKLCFAGEHTCKLIYDNLKTGVVCAIPLFESMQDMAKWQYGTGYKMLIMADSADTYWKLRMAQDSRYDHIKIASEQEVRNATYLLAEVMKIMADSLVTNWNHYDGLAVDDGGTSQKEMLRKTKDMLLAKKKVDVPNVKGSKGTPKFRLYVIDFGILYHSDPEGAKYIMDPYPALIKAGVNLSFHIPKREKTYEKCKLLPGCSASVSLFEEESADSTVDMCCLTGEKEILPKQVFWSCSTKKSRSRLLLTMNLRTTTSLMIQGIKYFGNLTSRHHPRSCFFFASVVLSSYQGF